MSRRSKSKFQLKSILFKILIIAFIVGVYYAYTHPELLPPPVQEILISQDLIPSAPLAAASSINENKMSSILGKTTSLVEEGLLSIKIPKNISGYQDEIVIAEIFASFTQKVKNLPDQQADRIKIQFCQDLLKSVENASVEVKSE